MKVLLSLLYKDLLLLLRDKAGLLLHGLMPLALVLIMTYIQDNTFNSIHENRIPVIVLNNDQDSLGNTIEQTLRNTEMFKVDVIGSGKEGLQTEEDLKERVTKGDYLMGIVIPENTSAIIRNNVKNEVACVFAGVAVPEHTHDSVQIAIYIDPVTKASFRATLMSNVKEMAAKLENQFTLNEIAQEIKARAIIPIGDFNFNQKPAVGIHETYASYDDADIIPNSVQHNVPAWTLFAIFFIVVTFAGNMIKEREDGSFTRLMIMPCPFSTYLLSKAIITLGICLVQFFLIVAMGTWFFPLINLPAFSVGGHLGSLLFIVICASLAAIGYGTAIGTMSTSFQQASVFGSVSVVILAAIGGIWVPVFIMPYLMKVVSKLSPLNWGLEAFYTVILRNGNFWAILPDCILLLAFCVVCFAISIAYRKYRSI